MNRAYLPHIVNQMRRRLVMSATTINTAPVSRHIGAWVLQGIVAAAFLAAAAAKLTGATYMVQLFEQIGAGQWFRYVTGFVELTGALALIFPRMASLGGLWLGVTMIFAVLTHLFVLHTSPIPAIALGLLSATIVYLRRDELAAVIRRAEKWVRG
jgi:putative oxidoreductase